MGALYRAGETKTRPGVYRRYEKTGSNATPGAIYGVFAIPVHADFGPLDTVSVFEADQVNELKQLYGIGGTVDAALALFDGGATKVYIYRLGTGGAVGTADVLAEGGTLAKFETKYPTANDFNFSLKPILGDDTKKQILVYEGAKLLETIDFAVSENEQVAIVEAVNKKSLYLKASVGEVTGAAQTMTNVEFENGTAPTVTTESYSDALTAFEAFKWNYLVLDTVDVAVHALVQAFVNRVFEAGGLGVCIIGEPTTVAFADRCSHAKAFNDEKIVYLGSGYEDAAGTQVNGYYAIAKQAGIIGSLPSNVSATHTVVPGAVNTLEPLKNSHFETAIESGMILLSPNDEGQVWFDSAINTLVSPGDDQDEGWKKIRRTSTRFEMFDRIDRAVAPLIGKVNCDDIGIGDVIMAAQAVLNAMVQEGKLQAGASITEDPGYRRGPDYSHFVINANDLDSLEKIYLRYMFRFSAE